MDRPGGLAAIGNSPVVRLGRLDDPLFSMHEVDEIVTVSAAEAQAMARRAAREQGVWSGPSTGANITAALAVARRLGAGSRVVTIQVDSGLKYLAGELYT